MAREPKAGRKDDQIVVRVESTDREWLEGLARDRKQSVGAVVRDVFAEARGRQLEEVAA